MALTEEDERTGKLLIGPSWAPEQGPFPAYNTNNDLGLIKPFWQAYVSACDVLKINSEIKTRVKNALDKFPEYPRKKGEFIDSLTAADFIGLNHPGLLAMVVPGQDIDADSPLAKTAQKTLHNYLKRTNRKSFSDRTSSACDLTWPWLVCIATKLRDTEFAEHVLMDIGISEFLKPNGMFAFIGGDLFRTKSSKRTAYSRKVANIALHALFSLSSTKKGKELTMSMLQQGSCYIYAINEMLMQSHSNTIRIFPSVPKCIGDCAFQNLRAEGSFLVSARKNKGKTSHITIKSLAGGSCRITIYDFNDKAQLTFTTSKKVKIKTIRVAPNTWEFQSSKGTIYYWTNTAQKSSFELNSSDVAGIKEFKANNGNILTYGKKGHLYEQ